MVKRLRPGKLASYGEIAEEGGFPGAARAVGGVLSRAEGLPWWRVIRADGRLVSPNQKEQARLLRKEGIRIERGRVVGTAGDDGTNGGDNTGDGDGTAGNDGTGGDNNTADVTYDTQAGSASGGGTT